MRWILSLFIFFILLFGTLHLVGKTLNTEYTPDEYVLIAEKIIDDMAKKLSMRHGMRVCGTVGGLAKRVNILGLRFQIQGPVEKDHLRKILVDCVEEFLTTINENKQIRPHLKNYPFTPHEIDIALFIEDGEGRCLPSSYIHCIRRHRWKIKICDFRRRQSIQCQI